MKKLIVADISSFSCDGKLIGHWPVSAAMYQKILKNDFNTYVAGSELYKLYISEKCIALPYGFDVLHKLSVKERIEKVLREIKNCRLLLASDAEIILFQSSGFVSMLYCLLTASKKVIGSKKIFFIQYSYQCDGRIKSFLYKYAKRNITGLITSTNKVGKQYDISYVSIPDYIYIGDFEEKDEEKFLYDFCMVGTMNDSKDIEMIIDTFAKYQKYKVKIAGFFQDKSRFQRLLEKATFNIELIDCYLTEEEFKSIIKNSRYCLLPYKKVHDIATSGVIYDYLFQNRPVIYRYSENFDFVEKYGAGLAYQNDIEEVLNYIDNTPYIEFKKGIKKLIGDNMKTQKKIIDFIKCYIN